MSIKSRILKSGLAHKATAALGNVPRDKTWLFVVGCYNSGTTLLADLLGSHQSVSRLPYEGVRMSDALPRPEDFGWSRMWAKCEDEMKMDGRNGESAASRVMKQWGFWHDSSAKYYLEKSIANAARIPFIDSYFKPVKFVYIVRNGYAASEGIRRKAVPSRWNNPLYKGPYPIDECVRQWVRSDEVVRATLPHQNSYSLRYEDLVEEPEAQLKRITDWLELEPIPQSLLAAKWGDGSTISGISNRNHISFKNLSEEEVSTISKIGGETLRRNKYNVIE